MLADSQVVRNYQEHIQLRINPLELCSYPLELRIYLPLHLAE